MTAALASSESQIDELVKRASSAYSPDSALDSLLRRAYSLSAPPPARPTPKLPIERELIFPTERGTVPPPRPDPLDLFGPDNRSLSYRAPAAMADYYAPQPKTPDKILAGPPTVAPAAGNQQALQEAYLAEEPPSKIDRLLDFVDRTRFHAEQTEASMLEGVAYLQKKLHKSYQKDKDLEDYALYQLGQKIRKRAEERLPADPGIRRTFLSETLPAALGSYAPMLALGAAGGAVTGVLGKGMQVGSIIAGGLSGMSMGAGSGYEEAKQAGATKKIKEQTADVNALLGITEVAPIERIFNRVDKATGGQVKRTAMQLIKEGFAGGAEELIQEVGQQIGSNAAAKAYDKERELLDGVVEAGGAGGIIGTLANVIIGLAGGGRPKKKGQPSQETAEIPPPPEGPTITRDGKSVTISDDDWVRSLPAEARDAILGEFEQRMKSAHTLPLGEDPVPSKEFFAKYGYPDATRLQRMELIRKIALHRQGSLEQGAAEIPPAPTVTATSGPVVPPAAPGPGTPPAGGGSPPLGPLPKDESAWPQKERDRFVRKVQDLHAHGWDEGRIFSEMRSQSPLSGPATRMFVRWALDNASPEQAEASVPPAPTKSNEGDAPGAAPPAPGAAPPAPGAETEKVTSAEQKKKKRIFNKEKKEIAERLLNIQRDNPEVLSLGEEDLYSSRELSSQDYWSTAGSQESDLARYRSSSYTFRKESHSRGEVEGLRSELQAAVQKMGGKWGPYWTSKIRMVGPGDPAYKSPNGEDALGAIGAEEMVKSIIAYHNLGEKSRPDAIVRMILEDKMGVFPPGSKEWYTAHQWNVVKNVAGEEQAVAATYKGKPEMVSIDSLSVGDEMKIAGEPFEVGATIEEEDERGVTERFVPLHGMPGREDLRISERMGKMAIDPGSLQHRGGTLSLPVDPAIQEETARQVAMFKRTTGREPNEGELDALKRGYGVADILPDQADENFVGNEPFVDFGGEETDANERSEVQDVRDAEGARTKQRERGEDNELKGQAGPAIAPEEEKAQGVLGKSSLPDYVVEEINRRFNEAKSLGVVEDIERMAAERKTAAEIRDELGSRLGSGDALERKGIVLAVRQKLGIPSMEERTEFENWIRLRSSQEEVAPPIVEPKASGPVTAKKEEPNAAKPKKESRPETVQAVEELDQALADFKKLYEGRTPMGVDVDLLAALGKVVKAYVKAKTFQFRDALVQFIKTTGIKAADKLEAFRQAWDAEAAVNREIRSSKAGDINEILSRYGGTEPKSADARPTGAGGNEPSEGGAESRLRVVDRERLPEATEIVRPDTYKGGSLDEHQRLGANLAIARFTGQTGVGFMLADGTGFGKTRQILAVADQIHKQTGKSILIVTQNKQIIQGSFAADAKAMGIDLRNFEIGTYDALRVGNIGKGKYALVIYDEAHNLKNAGVGKSEAARRVQADNQMFATATPLDKPTAAAYFLAEITGQTLESVQRQVGIVVDDVFNPQTNRVERRVYPAEHHVWSDVMDNLISLRDLAIRQGAMIRREYIFYGDLTERRFGMPADMHIEEQKVLDYWDARIASVGNPTAKRNISGQKTNELSRWTESKKVAQVKEIAAEELAAGRHVIIMAEGVNDTLIKGLNEEVPGTLGTLAKWLKSRGTRFAKIFGDGDKGAAVEEFQSGKVKIALATPKSGGTGINLDDVRGDRPRTMIILSKNFSGDVYDQVLGRVSRKTTRSPAKIIFIGLEGAFADERRTAILDRKLQALRRMQAGEDPDRAIGLSEEEVNIQQEDVEPGEASLGAVAVIPGLRESIAAAGFGPTAESILPDDPEVAKRLMDAHVPVTESWWNKVKSGLISAWHGLTRPRPFLDKVKFAVANDILRRFETQSARVASKTHDTLRKMIPALANKEDALLFSMKLVTEDQLRGLEDPEGARKLAYGWTPETLAAYKVKLDAQIAQNPRVQQALKDREETVRKLIGHLVELGGDPAWLKDPNRYWHRIVGEYRAATDAIKGQRLIKKTRKPFQIRRQAAEEAGVSEDPSYDPATNWAESEAAWVSQAITTIDTAAIKEELEGAYDISRRLKSRAKAQNYEAVVGGKDNLNRINWLRNEIESVRLAEPFPDKETKKYLSQLSAELWKLDPTMPYRQQIAVGLKSLGMGEDEFGEGSEIDFKAIKALAEQGDIAAASVLSAVAKREAFIKEELGNKYVTFRDLAPEGFRSYSPPPGHTFFRTFTVTDKVAEAIISGAYRDLNIPKSAVQQAIALGAPQFEWIVPDDLANHLESMETKRPEGDLGRMVNGAHQWWKNWQTTISPERSLAYGLGNMFGDLDPAIAAIPSALRPSNLSAAWEDLWNHRARHQAPSPTLRRQIENGVIGTGQTDTEVDSLSKDPSFARLMPRQFSWTKLPYRTLELWSDTMHATHSFREDWLRSAVEREYYRKLTTGESFSYGGSQKKVIDRIRKALGNEKAAAKLTLDLIGNYQDRAAAVKWGSRYMVPFGRWLDINLRREPRLLLNLMAEAYRESGGKASAATAAGVRRAAVRATVGGAGAAIKFSALATRAVALYGALSAAAWSWNHWMFPDIEDELSEDERSRGHLIVGRRSDGTPYMLRNFAALEAFADFTGISRLMSMVPAYMNGQISAERLVKEVGWDVVNNAIQMIGPTYRLPAELATGKSYYPDVRYPREATPGELISGTVGLTDEMKEIKGRMLDTGERGRPGRTFTIFPGGADLRRQSLADTYAWRERFLESIGRKEEGTYPRSAFRTIREAAEKNNYEAFKEALKVYREGGGGRGYDAFMRHLGGVDPLGNKLSDHNERKFLNEFLTPKQVERVREARDYAQEIRWRLWDWYRTATMEDGSPAEKRDLLKGMNQDFKGDMSTIRSKPERQSGETGAEFLERLKNQQMQRERALERLKMMRGQK